MMKIDIFVLKSKIAEIYEDKKRGDGWEAWSTLCLWIAQYEHAQQNATANKLKNQKFGISKYEVRQGDVLIFRAKEFIPKPEVEQLRLEAEKLFDNKVKCLFVFGDIDVGVISTNEHGKT